MYRGFNLKGFDVGTFDMITDSCVKGGITASGAMRSKEFSQSVLDRIRDLTIRDGVIDGDMLEAAWFPQGDFDVFVSHSHADRNKALALSGVLQEYFGLKAFVDSSVWDCRDRLIEKIRELSGNYPTHPCSDPEDENAVISHADMMLNCSLLRMIDSCECLMFLDTPRAIARYSLSDKTFSAWLYSEITISRYVRVNEPERRRNRRRLLNERLMPTMDSFGIKVTHNAGLGHLTNLTPEGFFKWAKMVRVQERVLSPLDLLYGLFPQN